MDLKKRWQCTLLTIIFVKFDFYFNGFMIRDAQDLISFRISARCGFVDWIHLSIHSCAEMFRKLHFQLHFQLQKENIRVKIQIEMIWLEFEKFVKLQDEAKKNLFTRLVHHSYSCLKAANHSDRFYTPIFHKSIRLVVASIPCSAVPDRQKTNCTLTNLTSIPLMLAYHHEPKLFFLENTH